MASCSVFLPNWKFFQYYKKKKKKKILLKNRNRTFPEAPYFTWKLDFVSNILYMIVSGNIFLPLTCPGLFRLTLFDNFGNSKVFNTVWN